MQGAEADQGLTFVVQRGPPRREILPPHGKARRERTAFAVGAQARVQREHLVFGDGPEAHEFAHQTFEKFARPQRFRTGRFAAALNGKTAIHEDDFEVGTRSQLVAAELAERQQHVGAGVSVFRGKIGLQGVESEGQTGFGKGGEPFREGPPVA